METFLFECIQDGEYSFSSDSVRVLQSLLDKSSVSKKQNPHLIKTIYAAVCGNPTLPQEFIELCHKSDFALVFSRLAKINMDICDICGFAACTGC
ncbi:guanylate cyclase activator 2B (uroguanylin) precursor [Silurus asotus]|uniref:Guanylate cyclase activator 2B n=1 Tax=Silurus asotus TaxID=30991 RepID=A0AAD5AF93_SILAS|nr:guanylate cyclase activator 2B (uroguanylin) precursor [Silurus asotus]